MRDIVLADTVFISFTTRAFATGIPTVLAGTPVISIYEDAGLTQITAGITLGVDHDSVVGLNMVTVVATGANGFENDKDYSLVITTGTVGGVSVVGEVVGQFSIQRAPVNWANVSNPTTALDLSGTDIQLVDTLTTYTGNTLQTADVAGVPTTAEFNARTLLAASYFDPAADAVANVTTVATTTTNTDMRGTDSALLAANISLTAGAVDNVTTVATTTTNTDMRGTDSAALAASFTFTVAGQVDANAQYWNDTIISTALETAADVTDAVWDELLSGHVISGSSAEALSAAGTAGDPWVTALPGAYGAGTAGKIVGDNINATVSSRMAEASIDTTAGAVDAVTLVATTTTNTDMVGTDSAALASVCTETRLAELDAGNLPTDIAAIPTTAMRGTDSAATAAVLGAAVGASISADIAAVKTATDAIPTTAMRGTDSAATEAKQDTMQTAVTAIKVPTDKMVFTKANELDANTKSINDAEVIGDGSATPWDGV